MMLLGQFNWFSSAPPDIVAGRVFNVGRQIRISKSNNWSI